MKNQRIAVARWPDAKVSPIANLRQTRAYDLLMRVPLVVYAVFFATLQMAGFARYMHEADTARPVAVHTIGTAMRLSTIAFLLLLAAATILRAPPRGKARGLEPRISALIGAFLVYAFPMFPRRELPLPVETVATVLILFGSTAAVAALLRLGHSFSMMAEARRLVTSGIYRIVRHPLYFAEEIAVIGIAIQFLSCWTLMLLAVQIAFQLRRMHNEELVLTANFPEYTAYRRKTARLIPGIY
jgi:protein-S-isoprenylcysteine O-methyltransferase Ste14